MIRIECPVSSQQVWKAVEDVLRLFAVHFDLCLGFHLLHNTDKICWHYASDVDITCVKRSPEIVTELLRIWNQLDFRSLLVGGERRTLIYSVDILRPMVSYGGCNVLAFASEELRNNREAALHVVRSGGAALAHASVDLRDDYEIVETAVRQFGGALLYASKRLRDDADLVHLASLTCPACTVLTASLRQQS